MSTDHSQKPQTQAQVYRERQMESLRRTLGDDILGFLNDPAIIEIMLNQDGRVWVDVLGGDMEPRSAMDPVRAKMVIETVASMLDTSITKENPIISGELPLDGSRFEAQIPPIVEAPTFAIRKKALLVFTLDDYVDKGIMTERQRGLIINAVRERKNILVSGGTGCHAKGTEIMMADGSLKKVEDIRVGDQVMGPDYQPRLVTELHHGMDRMVSIVPHSRKLKPFRVNMGHILSLAVGGTRLKAAMTVEDFLTRNYAPGSNLDRYACQHLMKGETWIPSAAGWLQRARNKVSEKLHLWRSLNGGTNMERHGFDVVPQGFGAYFGFSCNRDRLYLTRDQFVHHNSGKTTAANAILHAISEETPDHRIMIIQDTLELQCAAPNAVFFRTSDEIDMTRLLKSTMRMRPDRIIVGEVRGKEALDLLKAWSTGHPGGIGTVHANDARAALVRIGMLVQEANVPPNPELIAEAVNIVVSIKRTATGRIVDEVLAVKGFENGRFLTESL